MRLIGLHTLGLLLLSASAPAQAQDSAIKPAAAERQITTNIKTSFSFPIRERLRQPFSMRDLFQRQLSESISFNQPLQPASTPAAGLASQGDRGSSSSNFSYSVKYNPITYWFFQTSFSTYIRPGLKRAWNPDFTYSFGYDDWHPYTFSLTYANYGGNRFSPNYQKGESITHFNQGGVDLGWKFRIPLNLEKPVLEPRGASFGWVVNYSVSPRYEDLASAGIQNWKHTASLTCTNTVYKYFYWTATAMKYPLRRQEQSWDPDYTYGFGYFDYRRNRFSVEYNNFAGNRYPWSNQGKTPGSFRSGTLSIMWNLP